MKLYNHTETEAFLVQQDKCGNMLITWKLGRGKSVFLQGDDARSLEDDLEACGDNDSKLSWVLSAYTDVMA